MSSLLDCQYDYSYESPEAKVFAECDLCGDPIYVGDGYYRFEGMNICEDCMDECQKTAEEG